jgi:hypothetical protein
LFMDIVFNDQPWAAALQYVRLGTEAGFFFN